MQLTRHWWSHNMWINALAGGGTIPKVPTASLLCHFNGTDTSTTITDEYGNSCTAQGNAQIDTAQSKFSGASLELDGTGDYVDAVSFDAATPGSSDWLIEYWIRPDINNALKCIASKRTNTTSNGGMAFYVTALGFLYIQTWNASAVSSLVLVGDINITTATWHHVAALKVGATWGVLLDGVVDATGTESDVAGTAGTEVFRIGRDAGNTARDFDGHIDEGRIVKGTEVAGIYPNDLTSLVYDVPVSPFEKG